MEAAAGYRLQAAGSPRHEASGFRFPDLKKRYWIHAALFRMETLDLVASLQPEA
jgi:hypothetical protein